MATYKKISFIPWPYRFADDSDWADSFITEAGQDFYLSMLEKNLQRKYPDIWVHEGTGEIYSEVGSDTDYIPDEDIIEAAESAYDSLLYSDNPAYYSAIVYED